MAWNTDRHVETWYGIVDLGAFSLGTQKLRGRIKAKEKRAAGEQYENG